MPTPTPPLALPALPEPMRFAQWTGGEEFAFTADQMNAHATAAILSDRAGRGDAAGWVSVEDRLPDVVGIEDGGELLVANRAGTFVAVWEGTGATGFYAPDGDMFVQVTHWMPLPTPPAAPNGEAS